jgi:hypothetical protein
MQLRDHPLMSYRHVNNWPPVWTQTTKDRNITLQGEIGILQSVENPPFGDRNRVYLFIEHEMEIYIGTLIFDNAPFSWLIAKMLKQHIGWSIKELGDLDLSDTL